MDEEDVEPERLPMSLVTEPPQHPDVRRKIRIQYRTLLNDVSSEYQWRLVYLSVLCCPLNYVAWNFGSIVWPVLSEDKISALILVYKVLV